MASEALNLTICVFSPKVVCSSKAKWCTVQVNGTRTRTQTFNAANQADGFTYAAAGNLTNDGTAIYDALGRMTVRGSTTYAYNGDGTLVDDGTTQYAQDLAAPLSQVLQTMQGSATTNYLYRLDRLAAQTGSANTWYVGDALGSVRLTLDDAGAPLGVVHYDPWGTPESGNVPTFGFTGEVQDAGAGLVNLRARWYNTAIPGSLIRRFGSRRQASRKVAGC